MKRSLILSVLAGVVLTTTACSPIPTVASPEQEKQLKLQSAQHWGTIARHLSGQIISNSKIQGKTLFIDEEQFKTTFSTVFSKQLTSELVKNNVGVVLAPLPDTMELMIDIDVVRHPKDRDWGSVFPLTAGLANSWLIYKTGVYGLIPTVVAIDAANSIPTRTNTEIAVTTRIMDRYRIVFSDTNTYYITDKSFNQFEKQVKVKLVDTEVSGFENKEQGSI